MRENPAAKTETAENRRALPNIRAKGPLFQGVENQRVIDAD
jgi:hypothetical protein